MVRSFWWVLDRNNSGVVSVNKDETKDLNLECCVEKEFNFQLKDCKPCDGFNYNCPSYYSIRERLEQGYAGRRRLYIGKE